MPGNMWHAPDVFDAKSEEIRSFYWRRPSAAYSASPSYSAKVELWYFLPVKSLCGGGVSSSHPSFGSCFLSFFEQRNIHKNNSTQVQANLHKPHRYDPRRSDTGTYKRHRKKITTKLPRPTDWARDWRALALTHRKNLQTR